MQRLAGFQHHIVGDVYNVADGAHAGQAQPQLHPVRRRRHAHILHQQRGKARVERGRCNLHLRHGLRSRARGHAAPRQAHAGAGQRGNLARHAQHAGIARHVGRNRNLKHHIANVVGQRRAGRRRISVKQNHTFMFLGDAQFFFRAHHRVGIEAADFGALQARQLPARLVAVVQLRALARVRHAQRCGQRAAAFVRKQIRRTGEHRVLALAVVQPHQHQALGIRVRVHLCNVCHHNFVALPRQPIVLGRPCARRLRQPDVVQRLHLQPRKRKAVRQLVRREGDVHIISQPG